MLNGVPGTSISDPSKNVKNMSKCNFGDIQNGRSQKCWKYGKKSNICKNITISDETCVFFIRILLLFDRSLHFYKMFDILGTVHFGYTQNVILTFFWHFPRGPKSTSPGPLFTFFSIVLDIFPGIPQNLHFDIFWQSGGQSHVVKPDFWKDQIVAIWRNTNHTDNLWYRSNRPIASLLKASLNSIRILLRPLTSFAPGDPGRLWKFGSGREAPKHSASRFWTIRTKTHQIPGQEATASVSDKVNNHGN